MNSTENLPNVQSYIKDLIKKYPIYQVAMKIKAKGGQAYLVGGVVRDLVINLLEVDVSIIEIEKNYTITALPAPTQVFDDSENSDRKISKIGVDIKDIDIEVHGISMSDLEIILKQFGPINLVGKVFGVLRIASIDIDWSLPRIDSSGRKPKVEINENIDLKTALRRRDLTMNAMAINILSGQLIDPFGGIQDIKARVLRTPDINFFKEDPLRFYRIMQFIGRFNMHPDLELNNICSSMDIKTISKERIEMEFEKLLLLSRRPSLGIRWIHEIERIKEILPELADTIGILQESAWHPEGDVFEHSMQALDASAQLSYDSEYEKLVCMYAALCHDLGKVTTTKLINGKLRSFGHDMAGVPLTKSLLNRITLKKELIKSVCALVETHMQPLMFEKNNAGLVAYKKLAVKLEQAKVNILMLSKVALADRRGRNGCGGHEPLKTDIPQLDLFIEKAKHAGVLLKPIEPLLKGSDIADLIKPGPLMGEYLKAAYDYQIKKNINNKEILKDYVKNLVKDKKFTNT